MKICTYLTNNFRDLKCVRFWSNNSDTWNDHFPYNLSLVRKFVTEHWKREYVRIHLLKCGSLTVAFNPLNTKLNPNCHVSALLGAHHILHVSRIWVKSTILCDARSCYLTGSILLYNQVKHVKSLLFKVKYKLFSNTHYVAWSYLCRNTTSTSTSSRSSWRKSLRKCDTDSYVMCPHTTMCLKQSHTHTKIFTS